MTDCLRLCHDQYPVRLISHAAVTRVHACCAAQKNFNVYATATLSGDVANAIALLKRMARPAGRRHKAGLLIPAKELAACQVRPTPPRFPCMHGACAVCLAASAWRYCTAPARTKHGGMQSVCHICRAACLYSSRCSYQKRLGSLVICGSSSRRECAHVPMEC